MLSFLMAIDPDITRACTPDPRVYRDPALFRRQIDRAFARGWLCAAPAEVVAEPGALVPIVLGPGSLDEPLILARDEAGTLRGFSNACTHRGNLLLAEPSKAPVIRCGYHGRRFDRCGRFLSMPKMEAAADFPRPADDLPEVAVAQWGPLVFASLDPAVPFAEWIGPLEPWLGFARARRYAIDPGGSKSYEIAAHWALYADNYLEGFHIPFVHPGLSEALDVGAYRTELFPQASLQIGVAAPGEPALALPPGHPAGGSAVAGLYAWLFPATMINVYPWGISLNAIEPLAPDRTRVRYLTLVSDPERVGRGAGADLEQVEREDQAIVQAVQRGTAARLYQGGRYAPAMERAVHHFHRLLEASIGELD